MCTTLQSSLSLLLSTPSTLLTHATQKNTSDVSNVNGSVKRENNNTSFIERVKGKVVPMPN
jgi:hypothetical protein